MPTLSSIFIFTDCTLDNLRSLSSSFPNSHSSCLLRFISKLSRYFNLNLTSALLRPSSTYLSFTPHLVSGSYYHPPPLVASGVIFSFLPLTLRFYGFYHAEAKLGKRLAGGLVPYVATLKNKRSA